MPKKPPTQRQARDRMDRLLAIVAVSIIVLAWLIGPLLSPDADYDCRDKIFPEANQCREISRGTFEALKTEDGKETLLGWARIAEAPGYAGPITVMVGVNPAGEIFGVDILDESETPAYLRLVEDNTYLEDFQGIPANSALQLGIDVDAVTSATYTSKGILEAAREASYEIAESQLSLDVPREPAAVEFGLPEIILIALFAVGFVAHRGGFPYKKVFRWASMLTGMVFLGFVYNSPVTIAHFNSLLLGYWPDWHTNLYWFLLMGGMFFVVTVDGKNPYCQWFCPFGAAQECLGAIGGAKTWLPRQGRFWLEWAKRGLALSAIVIGLLFRNPGISSYEIFGALFSFNAVGLQWTILIIILLTSLFVRRPWCNFLCPVDPIVDLIFAGRRWIRQGVLTWKKRSAQAQ